MSNGEAIWDLAGNVWEWTQGTITGAQPGLAGESSFAWKDYNNSSLRWISLPSSSRPTGGTLYSRSSRAGGLSSNSGDTALRAFLRGGYWSSSAGVLTLNLLHAPSSAYTSTGFRAAR